MKKPIKFSILALLLWIGFVKFIDPSSAYPWEFFINAPKIEKTLAWKAHSNCWDVFRLNFPYHIQTIGISNFEQDHSKIVIVSEPPSHFNVKKVKKIFKRFKLKSEINKHTLGYDGWVKDFTLVLSGGSNRQYNVALKKLYKHVYGSNYNPHFYDLNQATTPPVNEGGLNHSISAAEINSWFVEGEDKFFYKAGTTKKEKQLNYLLEGNQYGVYYSKRPGFVAWIIPKGSISEFKEDAFRFTLDADLIIGAIANHSSLAIIGKQRTENEYLLPPLRVEMLLKLAAADKQQISQSYDRNNMFAGKIQGGKDWAPIYLSDDLLNTEYGSLLNVTDQMLKGWSQHGEVTYHNFMYPKPVNYPIGQAIHTEIGTESLTFNWNTKGAAYTVQNNELEIVALNRTGALPVTYIPEGIDQEEIPFEKIRSYEEKFYNFFSKLKDPNLVRVVQYAAVYQIFSAFEITAEEYQNSADKPSQDVTTEYSSQLLNAIINYEPTDFRNPEIVTERLLNILSAGGYKYSSELLNKIDNTRNINDLNKLFQQADDDQGRGLRLAMNKMYKISSFEYAIFEIQGELQGIQERFGDPGISILSFLMGHPRFDRDFSYNSYEISDDDCESLITWYESKSEVFQFINQGIDLIGFSRNEIMDDFVESYRDIHNDWIKTPSIVLSWSVDSMYATGGHNIDARMLGLQVDKTLAKGQIRVVEENGLRKLYVAADDLNRISPKVIRALEAEGTVGMQTLEGKMLGGAIRSREKVISTGTKKPQKLAAKYNNNTGKRLKDEIVILFDNKAYKKITIGKEEFYAEAHSPHILFPKSQVNNISALNAAMKNRKIIKGEVKAISFVEDATTNKILKNYCNKDLIEAKISNMKDLELIFSQHPGKTFPLMGHIENGAIYMPELGVKFPIAEITLAAQRQNVNFLIVGCESGVSKSSTIGFAHKINSVEAAKALGMAMENPQNTRTFIHNLARNTKLRFIVRDEPFKDLGYAAIKADKDGNKVVLIVAGGALGGAILIVSTSGGGSEDEEEEEEEKDKKQGQKI